MLSFFQSIKYKNYEKEKEFLIMKDILKDETLDCKSLHSIIKHQDPLVRIQVLFHKNCTRGIIAKLLIDDDINVRLSAEDRLEALKKPTYYTK